MADITVSYVSFHGLSPSVPPYPPFLSSSQGDNMYSSCLFLYFYYMEISLNNLCV